MKEIIIKCNQSQQYTVLSCCDKLFTLVIHTNISVSLLYMSVKNLI